MERVCLSRQADYELEALVSVVDSHFRRLGIYEKLRPGMNVVIKPNLVLRSKPEEAVITHPNVTAAVGLCVQKAGATVLLAESGGGPYFPSSAAASFKACSYEEMAQKHGFSLYTQCKSRRVFLKNGVRCKSLEIVEPFLSCDFFINVAKLKTHGMMGLSGASKNLFGAVPGLQKPELHCRFPQRAEFAEMLNDLADFLRPGLSVIDGVMAMEGNGPTGGTPRFVGALISGENSWAADVVGAELLGLPASRLPMLANAISRGFCPDSSDKIQVLGDSIEQLRVKDFQRAGVSDTDFITRLPKPLRPLAERLTASYPKINEKECVGCGKCEESCPQHTIAIVNNKAKVEYKNCIRCFCCHEMCPRHVIDIRRLGFLRH